MGFWLQNVLLHQALPNRLILVECIFVYFLVVRNFKSNSHSWKAGIKNKSIINSESTHRQAQCDNSDKKTLGK